ncbi:prepilin peptidase [Biformimicrobium ophioploci]|uniref:Prepilin leader peptidase/N-methyltransferase n=1 Tax=Biformimicrobium ophioploci TaxID=3036711 RepID=A0ABQ6LX93_9GAMM|nr:A24 family peptidase [Microbulbifer sp. NKW57]GMG86660.1 A24 family peptidase [Microbulbifer sp. NKW57]
MLETLFANKALLLGSAFVLGLLVGSFLNVVIYRLPLMMEREFKLGYHEHFDLPLCKADKADLEAPFNLVLPHSHCPKCEAEIKPWHNIPLISYLMLGGKCGNCGTRISARYPGVELITGLLTAFVVWHFGPTWQAAGAILFTWALVALTGIDFDHHLLPDDITLPLLWTGLLFNIFGVFTSLQDAVIGAIAGYLALWSVYHLFKLITGKEGMGAGDFKILAAIGAWLGWQILPLVIILSAGVGAVVGITWTLIAGRDKNLPIAFGPFLAGAGWIAMLWGTEIWDWYMAVSGLGQ